jgi:hypothetical protein
VRRVCRPRGPAFKDLANHSASVLPARRQYIASGGTASNTVLNGAFDVVFGTTLSTVSNSNSVDYVYSGGVSEAALTRARRR